jgi:hypothetical protein
MINSNFSFVKKQIYDPCNLICTDFEMLPESKEYGACQFTINQKQIQFRVAKITPTKIGQFVTFWKRLAEGPIAPYDMADEVDYFVVSVRDDINFGLFIFPKLALLHQGYVSKNRIGGKRAMRVYPSWDKPVSSQAIQTQKWQLKYFIAINEKNIDVEKIQKLFL